MPIAAKIYYHIYEGGEEGEKPAVILIHGAGGTHLFWPSETRRLPGYRIYAIDLPGHGKSTGSGQQSTAAYLEQILEWLEAIGVHSAVFVGHSLGSAIALDLSLNYPQHVLGLALVGAGAQLRVSSNLLEMASSPTTFSNAVSAIINWSFGSQASPELTELATRRMAETRPSVLYGDLLACDTFDKASQIEHIRKPTLILCGAEDKMTPVRNAQFLRDTIAGAQLKIFENAGHMVMLEQPKEIALALEEFLSTIAY